MALNPVSRWIVPFLLLLLGALPILTGAISLSSVASSINSDVLPEPDILNYVQNPWPITLHIVAGSLFNILGPFQFVGGLRARFPLVHRVSGRLFILAGLVAAITAFYMNQFFPFFGGFSKYWSNLIFSIAIPVLSMIALRAAMTGNFAKHRAFMMRTYAIGLGVATQRLILLPYFIVFGMPTGEMLGLLLIFCWCINLTVVELILRRKSRSAPSPMRLT